MGSLDPVLTKYIVLWDIHYGVRNSFFSHVSVKTAISGEIYEQLNIFDQF